tara:strand:+ start:9885 stop:11018 length:1134 start_codon:yes stop_codon:yes gene_type:complete
VNKAETEFINSNAPLTKQVAVIGGGVIGRITAWHLASFGYEIVLIDPSINQPINRLQALNGTSASLGILMGNVFRRSHGRSWRLRRRSMELWDEWISKLSTPKMSLEIQRPLVLLARSKKEASFMQTLTHERADLDLEMFPVSTALQNIQLWPSQTFGGLISHKDGRIDPLQLQKCLLNALKNRQVETIAAKVTSLERNSVSNQRRWKIHLSNHQTIRKDIAIICASLGSEALLRPLGHSNPITAVLGQVINLELKENTKNWSGWPAVLATQGINLIPNGTNNILMGATLEPGENASAQAILEMKGMQGNAPEWINTASITEQWSGLRAKPTQEAAPLMKTLEPGLILATGHYRNGVLLAPATAEWVATEIMNNIKH